jgi:hypothetical protein
MTLWAHSDPAAPIIAALSSHPPNLVRTMLVPTDAEESGSSRVARRRRPGPDSLYRRPTNKNSRAPTVATPSVVLTGIPARPSDPRVYVVAFWKKVCTMTSNASVAIAMVDSVMRMMAPPKMAATTTEANADSAIAGTRPRSAVPSADGSSGSWALFTASGIVVSAVV